MGLIIDGVDYGDLVEIEKGLYVDLFHHPKLKNEMSDKDLTPITDGSNIFTEGDICVDISDFTGVTLYFDKDINIIEAVDNLFQVFKRNIKLSIGVRNLYTKNILGSTKRKYTDYYTPPASNTELYKFLERNHLL